jgi:hypothetical protein
MMSFSEQMQGFNYVGVRSRILAGDIVERHSQFYRIDVWDHQIIKIRSFFEQRTGSVHAQAVDNGDDLLRVIRSWRRVEI